MQAALTCAERGHKVTLCEKNAKLGGALLCEEAGNFQRETRAVLSLSKPG